MAEQHDFTERIHLAGENLMDQVEKLIHEGNVRRIVVKNKEHQTVAEFPLTIGVVGVLLAPMLAAIGAAATMVADCTIEVERTTPEPREDAPKD